MEFKKNAFEIYRHLVKLGQDSRILPPNHGALFLFLSKIQYPRSIKIVFEKKSGRSSGHGLITQKKIHWNLEFVVRIGIGCSGEQDKNKFVHSSYRLYKKKIKKKLNLQLHHHNENLRPQVDMTHNNRYQNRSRTVGHKPDHPRKIIIRENTDMWKNKNKKICQMIVRHESITAISHLLIEIWNGSTQNYDLTDLCQQKSLLLILIGCYLKFCFCEFINKVRIFLRIYIDLTIQAWFETCLRLFSAQNEETRNWNRSKWSHAKGSQSEPYFRNIS